jgi:integrase
MSLNDHTHTVNQTPNTQKANNLRLSKLLKEVGFPALIYQKMTMHGWRHTLVTAYMDAGIKAKDVEPLMGHTPQIMQAYYDHALDSNVEEAAYTIM